MAHVLRAFALRTVALEDQDLRVQEVLGYVEFAGLGGSGEGVDDCDGVD